MRPLRSKFRSSLAAVATAGLLVTACGGSGGGSLDVEQDPAKALSTAVQGISSSDGIEAVLSLDADADDIAALAADGGDELPDGVAELITNSNLRFRGKGTGTDAQFEMALVLDGDEAFEMRVIGEEIYVRADVEGLIERFDTTGTGLAEMQQGLAQMQGMGMDFLQPAVEGEWLHLTGAQQVMEMMQGFAGGQMPDEAEVEKVGAEIEARLQTFFSNEVDVEYVGSEDAGERVRATATGDELLDLGDEIFALMGPLAAGFAGGQDPAMAMDQLRAEVGADAAKFTLPIDMWIDGDRLSRVGFDVIAFASLNEELMGADAEPPAGLDKLAIIVDLNEFGGGVDAPDGAVEVNLFELFGQFAGGLGGAGLTG